MASSPERNDDLVVTRVFDAPRELVFEAWTQPEHLMRWWAPKNMITASCKVDLRPGGSFHYCMRAPDGMEIWGLGLYREIVAPERLVYTDMFADADGNPVPPTHYGASPEFPAETLVTITFAEQAGGTRVTLRQTVPPALKEREGMEQGWNEMLDGLAGDLESAASDREIVATRMFDAPRELVFRMWTDPQHVAQWWGPRGFTNTISTMDVRPGGVWEFVMHGPDGVDYKNKVVYIEVVRPERIVYDHVSGPLFHVTTTFADEGGKTRVNVRMLFESAALRNKVAEEYGAVEGLGQTLDRLGEQLAKRPNDVTITRVFDAPPSLVFKAWTDPKLVARWWGPHEFTNPRCEVDARPGGAIRIDMRGPDGTVYPMTGVFHEVVEPVRLVFTSTALDGALEVLNTVTFIDENGKTKITMQATVLKATPEAAWALSGMEAGWTQSFEKLGAML